MKNGKFIVSIAASFLCVGTAFAQTTEAARETMVEREVEVAEELRAAEARMAEAAQRIAELTADRVPQLIELERRFEFSNRPRIGVTIDGSQFDGAVDGVNIEGVTPGSAADDAGLRAGDIITDINGESLAAKNSTEANKRLLDFMQAVEEGDVLEIDYSRNGNEGTVEVSPKRMDMQAFSWAPDVGDLHIKKFQGMAGAPRAMQGFRSDFGFHFAGSSLGHMELVQLNEGLGKYFGTDSGLLVVSAPTTGDFDLQDGDVIQSIDGREPKDVRHALRILGSYQGGETLELGIMRDKKKRTLEIEVPENQRSSWIMPAPPAAPPAAPSAVTPARIAPSAEIVIIESST